MKVQQPCLGETLGNGVGLVDTTTGFGKGRQQLGKVLTELGQGGVDMTTLGGNALGQRLGTGDLNSDILAHARTDIDLLTDRGNALGGLGNILGNTTLVTDCSSVAVAMTDTIWLTSSMTWEIRSISVVV